VHAFALHLHMYACYSACAAPFLATFFLDGVSILHWDTRGAACTEQLHCLLMVLVIVTGSWLCCVSCALCTRDSFSNACVQPMAGIETLTVEAVSTYLQHSCHSCAAVVHVSMPGYDLPAMRAIGSRALVSALLHGV
jgi:hypothetical protein